MNRIMSFCYPHFETEPVEKFHLRQAWDRWIYEEGGQVVDDITVVSW